MTADKAIKAHPAADADALGSLDWQEQHDYAQVQVYKWTIAATIPAFNALGWEFVQALPDPFGGKCEVILRRVPPEPGRGR